MNFNRLHKKFPTVLPALLCGLFLLLLLRQPQLAAQGVRQGLTQCYQSLIPALFPFLILTRVLLGSGAGGLLGLPLAPYCRALRVGRRQSGAALALGLLGGFAAAGSGIDSLYRQGQISAKQAQVLLCAAVGEGPAFVLFAVGAGLLGSLRTGAALLFSLTLASLLCAVPFSLFLLRGEKEGAAPAAGSAGGAAAAPPPHRTQTAPGPQAARPGLAALLVQAVAAAVDGMLQICGFVVLFHLFCNLLAPPELGALPRWLLTALLEVTAGCSEAAAMAGSAGVFFCAVSLSLLGLCAFTQLRALVAPEIRLWPLLLSRLIHLPLTLGLLRFFLWALPAGEDLPTALGTAGRLTLTLRLPRDAAFFLFLMLAVFCCELLPRRGAGPRRGALPPRRKGL